MEQEQEYTERLKKDIQSSRQSLRNHMRHVLRIDDTSQSTMRRLSWIHQERLDDPDYSHRVNILLKDFELPIPLCRTQQDAYHHTHFIAASILCILDPEFDITFAMKTHIMPLARTSRELSDIDLLEKQHTVYLHLTQQLPYSQETRKYTITRRMKALEERVTKLEEHVYATSTTDPEAT